MKILARSGLTWRVARSSLLAGVSLICLFVWSANPSFADNDDKHPQWLTVGTSHGHAERGVGMYYGIKASENISAEIGWLSEDTMRAIEFELLWEPRETLEVELGFQVAEERVELPAPFQTKATLAVSWLPWQLPNGAFLGLSASIGRDRQDSRVSSVENSQRFSGGLIGIMPISKQMAISLESNRTRTRSADGDIYQNAYVAGLIWRVTDDFDVGFEWRKSEIESNEKYLAAEWSISDSVELTIEVWRQDNRSYSIFAVRHEF